MSGVSTPATATATVDLNNLLNGGVFARESAAVGRWAGSANLAALTTQVMLSVAVPLVAGDVITSISFRSGNTAATPTNYWFALYSSAATPLLLSQTTDQLTAAWAANTWKTLALSTNGGAQTIPSTGVYYASIMVNGTPPTLSGAPAANANASQAVYGAVVGSQKILAQTSGSALTTTAPASITGGTVVGNLPYALLT